MLSSTREKSGKGSWAPLDRTRSLRACQCLTHHYPRPPVSYSLCVYKPREAYCFQLVSYLSDSLALPHTEADGSHLHRANDYIDHLPKLLGVHLQHDPPVQAEHIYAAAHGHRLHCQNHRDNIRVCLSPAPFYPRET